MSHITIPATGSGDATPEVATDLVSSAHYQYVKLADGTVGGANPAAVDNVGNLQVRLGAASPGVFVGASVSNFPATQNVSGGVTASVIGYVGASVTNFPATQPVSGGVTASVIGEVGASVTNFPANQNVTITGQPVSVSGNVTASVVGYVGASITNAGALSAASQVLVGGSTTVFVASAPPQTLAGFVGASVSNFPATQNVAGGVTASVIGYVGASITNPGALSAASQVVVGGSITLASAVPGIFTGASISNFPATQPVSGNVTASVIGQVGASVSNTPQVSIASYSVTQPVSVASTSVTQPVSGNVTASVIGYVGASITNGLTLSGQVGASVSNWPYPTYLGSVIGYVGASLVGTPQVSVSNFPGTQPVSGNVTASTIGYVGASVTNFPANQGVTIASTSVTQPVSGNVTASVIGYVGASVVGTPTVSIASSSIQVGVSVANFPVNIGSDTSFIASAYPGVMVGASISNFPGTQPVSGNVTASVIGYVGASIPAGASVNSFNVGGSVVVFPDAAPVSGFGASPYSYITGASFNNLNVKNSAGTLYDLVAMNTNTSPRFLRLFDKAGTPSPGTDQRPFRVFTIPGASAGAGVVNPLPVGILFANGLGFDVTGGSVGASDTTATGLGDVVVNLSYS